MANNWQRVENSLLDINKVLRNGWLRAMKWLAGRYKELKDSYGPAENGQLKRRDSWLRAENSRKELRDAWLRAKTGWLDTVRALS